MEISTVPIHYVKAFLRAAQRHGLVLPEILSAAGIDTELLEGERARVTGASFIALSQYLSRALEDESAGMMSQRTKPGTFAMMCHACNNCATLGEFLQRCAQYSDLVNDCIVVDLHRYGERARFSITALPGMVDEDEVVIMILLSVMHRFAGWLIGQTMVLSEVGISRRRPSYAHEYNFLFMAPIAFSQNANSLHFASSYLDMPVLRELSEFEQFLSQPFVQLMANPDFDRSLAAKIRTMIKADVAGRFPDFNRLAVSLHLTPATLRRRLRDEGCSYQKLKDDMRRDAAIHYLGRGTLSMEQVAESVGFAEPTSFFRAFKRWTGVTPRAYVKNPAA
ncbi:MAG: AraC family transcriptional regulator [Spongiibacteraceae bacterium]